MKTLTAVLLALLSLNAFAMEVDVISAEFQVENELEQKSLCLTVVRVPESGEFLGIVEDIHDCFYAREARRNPHRPLELHPRYLQPVTHPGLLDYLQRLDSQLKFYFSNGE